VVEEDEVRGKLFSKKIKKVENKFGG